MEVLNFNKAIYQSFFFLISIFNGFYETTAYSKITMTFFYFTFKKLYCFNFGFYDYDIPRIDFVNDRR